MKPKSDPDAVKKFSPEQSSPRTGEKAEPMKPCRNEDDCPTPTWCRGKDRCPKLDAKEPANSPLRAAALFGFLWDFRERAVNHASYLYGFFTVGAMLWMIEGVFLGDPWDFAKAIGAAITAKFFQTRHPLICNPNAAVSHGDREHQPDNTKNDL